MANKNRVNGCTRIVNATRYSLKGLKAVWKNEIAFRQEVIVTVIGIFIAFILQLTTIERVLLIGSLTLVIIVEIINSAIETIIDYMESKPHPLAGQAKDMGSAAVFIALLIALFTWISVLHSHFYFNF